MATSFLSRESLAATESRRLASSRPLVVRFASPSEAADWDAAARGFSGVHFHHLSRWAEVLARAYNFKPHYLQWKTDDRVRAMWPMMEVSAPFSGRRGVCLPFTDVCSPLIAETGLSPAQLVDEMLTFARGRNWAYVDFRLFGQPLSLAPSISFFHHQLDLDRAEEELFKGFKGAARRAVRRAVRSHLCVEFLTGQAAASAYYHLHCLTRKRHGLPPQPWKFFAAVGQYCLDDDAGFVTHVRLGNQPVAAALFLRDRSTAYYKFGASDHRLRHVRGNNMVMWESIRKLVREGCHTLDFGRTSLANEGLRHFKMNWGCRESQISYYRLNPVTGAVKPVMDRAHGWYNHLFRVLPVPLLRLVGRLIYANQA